ncbi:MAG: GNAT family N-acetyltransferase [Chloroflexi bacterium]|jgi:RimJ/RimL family protein N-acetyltransferase|nr:GNAT family N-acetyltransferase [Chloroflexota bacterium]NCA12760.1 N-acetyltransferase [Pseudomonadota bacterium]
MRGGNRRAPAIRAGRLVRIRRATEADQPALTALRDDAEIDHFMGVDSSPTAWLWRHIPLGEQSSALTDLLVTTLDGLPIGLVSLWDRSVPHDAAELSIWLGSQHRDRGLGTEALRLSLRYAFDDLELHKVYLRVLDYNLRARRAYEKCGFVVEGYLREEMRVNGTWHTLIYMGVLGPDFEAAEARQGPLGDEPRVPPAIA